MLAVTVLLPGLVLRVATPPVHQVVGGDAALWRSGGQVLLVLGGRTDEGDLLQGLREAGVTGLDVVVCRSSAGTFHQVVADLRRRYGGFTVLAPVAGGLVGAVEPADGSVLRVGALVGHLDVSPDAIEIEVGPASGDGAGPV